MRFISRKNILKILKIIKALIPFGILAIKNRCQTKNIFYCFRGNYKYFSIGENSVLLVEFFTFHGETLPGFAKYFLDIGCNVDVVLHKPIKESGRNDPGLFSFFGLNNKVRIITLSAYDINFLLRSSIVARYKHVLLNSFYDGMERNYLFNVDLFKLKPICVAHNYDITNSYFKTNKVISLVKMECVNRKPPFVVNPHYFGEFTKREKSEITTFVILNSTNLFRRNIFLLFEACDRLYEMGINNFSVKIIGKGINIPEKYFNNFQIFGFLDFQRMYEEISISDFILALIDQASIQYTNKASGTYQLSYGFLKPIVLHKKFSDVSGFNNSNSILYNDNNNLAEAMEKCINMANEDYLSIVKALEISEKELYNTSLNNLREVLQTSLENISHNKL